MRTSDPGLLPVVDGWELTRLLGVGGSAQVWLGTPTGGGAPAAVKLLPLADGTAPGAAAAEAALLSGLDHPHLVALHEVVAVQWPGTGRPGLALVLDLAAAGSLADLLRRRGRLAPGEVVTAVAPVGLALAHVHEQAFVHGDVTPGNLLFSADGVPLLADLGVAKVVGGYGEVRTTAAYADPVVAAGGRPSTASDVFMLAATAFHALTGAPPWPDPLPGVALARAARADVGPLHRALESVPEAVAAVLVEALRPEPHLRPTAAAFALDLGRAVRPVAVDFDAGRAAGAGGQEVAVWTGSPVPTGERETFAVEDAASAATPPPTEPRASSPGRRRVLIAAGASLAAVAAVVVGGLAIGGRERSPTPAPVAAVSTAAPAGGSSAPVAVRSWGEVLTGLDHTRAAAYAAGDPARLAQVYAAPTLLAADRATLVDQVPTGCSLHGATTTYADVRADAGADAGAAPTPASHPARVVLRARATLAASVLTCRDRPDTRVDGLGPTSLTITLTAVADGYRIAAQSTG